MYCCVFDANRCFRLYIADKNLYFKVKLKNVQTHTQMYTNSITAPARLVMFDVLQGSVERIIASNSFLTLLERLGLSKMIVHSRHESYTVTTQVSHTESFSNWWKKFHSLILHSKGHNYLSCLLIAHAHACTHTHTHTQHQAA